MARWCSEFYPYVEGFFEVLFVPFEAAGLDGAESFAGLAGVAVLVSDAFALLEDSVVLVFFPSDYFGRESLR